MTKLRFRRCQPSDWRVLLPIALNELPAEVTPEVASYLFQNCLHHTFVVETETGEIAGYWMLDPTHPENRGWLEQIVVSSKFQRQGIGKKLLIHFEETCAGWGYSEVGLAVYKSSVPAIQLYRHLGFSEIKSDNDDPKTTFIKKISGDGEMRSPSGPSLFDKFYRKVRWIIK